MALSGDQTDDRCPDQSDGRKIGGIFLAEAGHSELPDNLFRAILDALPAAIYVTDALGRITYFNEAAAALWGHRPALGKSEWCGSWKLFWPDGRIQSRGECPMAMAIKEKRAVWGSEAIAERPDGTRVPFIAYPTPLFDSSGDLIGAVNLLIDLTDREEADQLKLRLATIVEFSDDAIISKDLNGIIKSWNAGAQRMFGYTADEVIRQRITLLIPTERQSEEDEILGQLRKGNRIEHYETVRRRKDGTLVDVSLTVSPIKDSEGKVIGASKIARDITERKRAEQRDKDRQRELMAELDDMRRLQQISIRLLEQDDFGALYDGILDAAVGLLRSDMGSLQLLDPLRGELRLLSARGFEPASINAFEWVGRHTSTSCGAALRAGRRVIIPDIEACNFMAGTPAYEALRHCGIRAAQSTPLVSRSGAVIGMVTNHWRKPYQPTERDLMLIDVLARQAADLIERKRNEEQITLIAREAEHRAKNLLATVQATVHLTQADTSDEFKEAIEGRVQALANINGLFVQSRWAGAELSALISQELSPFNQHGRVQIDGPPLSLEPSVAQAVALCVHELATNAAKYGAFSVPHGRVRVEWWQIDGSVSIRWIEAHGPAVKPPTRKGFGSRMMSALVRQQLKGKLRFDWQANGLTCEITLPVAGKL